MIAVRKRFAFDVHSLCRIRWSVVKLVKVAFTMNDEPIVSVNEGKLRGGIVKGVLGTSYIAFKGIPFAAPPVGELRFKVKNHSSPDYTLRLLHLYFHTIVQIIGA